ncbi:MAG: Exodeoxyribonuclease 7 large subunit [Firmicutes bacterium]|nr:Exodeoxyribonuclease 7 large subunit [Bacillota bacterium]
MQIISVTELTRYIKKMFETDSLLGLIYVRGEISNFKRHYSGHCYFTLKDQGSTIRAVMFKGRAQYLKFAPYDGLKVVAGGRVTVFERDGQYQLYVDQLMPEGIGELSLAFEQLKKKLTEEGLFDERRKKGLPFFPRSVGIVTSLTGAVLRDIITVSKRRNPNIALTLYPVQVQGTEAPMQIAHAIEVFNRLRSVDVLIIGRGGGSIEELWAFNDEKVVRAIAASEIPIVSAVGHETDYTLADFAADYRAATPSQAAEIVVPDTAVLRQRVMMLRAGLTTNIRALLRNAVMHVTRLINRRVFTNPQDLLVSRQQTVDMFGQRLIRSMQRIHTAKQNRLQVLSGKLDMLSPLAVLSRGYSITRLPDGQVLQSAEHIFPGQNLEVVLRRGMLGVSVTTVEKGEIDGKK